MRAFPLPSIRLDIHPGTRDTLTNTDMPISSGGLNLSGNIVTNKYIKMIVNYDKGTGRKKQGNIIEWQGWVKWKVL